MKLNGDLQILEAEWEDLDNIQLNSPTQIQKYLGDIKVGCLNLSFYSNIVKAPYSSKIDIFIQERFNKLIYGINTIIKCGI